MATKLYKAEITSVYYFLAEEGTEEDVAEDVMEEALDNDNEKRPDVSEVKRYEDTMDWNDKTWQVYGRTAGDTTLAEAYQIGTGQSYENGKKEAMERFSAVFAKSK